MILFVSKEIKKVTSFIKYSETIHAYIDPCMPFPWEHCMYRTFLFLEN